MKKTIDTKELIQKYRIYLIPCLLIGLSVLMIFFVIIPQFSFISDNSHAIDEQKNAIKALESSQKAITEINSANIDSSIKTVNTALPTGKDVVLIYSALSNVAGKNNVKIRTFSIKVGNFYTQSAGAVSKPVGSEFSNLKVLITVQATKVSDILDFAKNISEALPITDVNTVQSNGQDGTLEVLFYYKPFDVASFSRINSIAALSPAEKSLLEKLSQWDTNE